MTEVEVLGPEESGALAEYEQEELEHCEGIIQSGIKNFFEVGHALTRIRDLRLYRETHPNFEVYLEERWDYSRQYGYQLIAAAAAAENVSAIGRQPNNERQVRVLTPLDADLQKRVWARAIAIANTENGGRVTAKIVGRALKEVQAQDAPADEEERPGKIPAVGPVEESVSSKAMRKIVGAFNQLQKSVVYHLTNVGGDNDFFDLSDQLKKMEGLITRIVEKWGSHQ